MVGLAVHGVMIVLNQFLFWKIVCTNNKIVKKLF